MQNLLSRLDWRLDWTAWFPFVVLLLLPFACLYLPERYSYENHLIESVQMVVLVIGFVLCCLAKTEKKLFRFAAMLIFLLAMREVNYGRFIFFTVPGNIHAALSWEQIGGKKWVHSVVWGYGFFIVLYFFWNKLYLVIWNYIKNAKFPVWSLLLLLFGAISGKIGDESIWPVFEETTELIAYLSMVSLLYLYGFRKEFILEQSPPNN